MKKFILFMMTLFMCLGINAQKAVETSRFTDNMSVTLQGGVVTSFNDFFKNGSTTPVVVLGVDKFINPWLGFGIDGRTSIGTGDNYNIHTAFDMVNVSGYVKVNLTNAFNYTGTRKFFEPIVYTGLGWNHVNCSKAPSLSSNYDAYIQGVPTEYIGVIMRNSVSYRAGVELNFNLGKEKAWGIVVNPSVVWANIDNGRLDKRNGNFEITAGVKYHFTNSNGTNTFKVHDIGLLNDNINALRHENEILKNRKPEVITNTTTIIKENTVDRVVVVTFAQNSDELSAEAISTLNSVKASSVMVVGYASPEGSTEYNQSLSAHRAANVADYLSKHGINITSCEGKGAVDNNSNRIVYVIAQ